MTFMIIERFAEQNMEPVYQRLNEQGRGLPEGLLYIGSWVEANFGRCFQLVETDDLTLLMRWIQHWQGCGVTFEVVPIVPGSVARELVVPTAE